MSGEQGRGKRSAQRGEAERSSSGKPSAQRGEAERSSSRQEGTLEIAAAVRRAVGLFALPLRAIVEVSGGDRVRWLDGMISNDVRRLEPGPERSGCRALALTRKGGVVADLRVWLRERAFWLETDAAAIPGLLSHLRGLVVADDVRLAEAGSSLELVALEGPAARELLERAAACTVALAEGAVGEFELAGLRIPVAAYGESGEPAYRLALPVAGARRAEQVLVAAGAACGLVAGSEQALEILRIEAGTPRYGAELGPDVLPAEARLEAAIAFDKGCYTGQEIVARVESRGQVRRQLVGLTVEGGFAPAPGAPIEAGADRVGEVTSGCVSPARGAIALGFVRVPHDASGTALRVGGRRAEVAPLPFVESRVRR